MKKTYTFLLIAFMFLIISCSEKNKAEINNNEKKEVRKISINENEEPESLNPNLTTDSTGTTVNSIMSEGLMRSDKDGIPTAGLAEKWEVSEDGLTWKFYLRDNLKWSDGSPLTAGDFGFSWLKVLEPSTGAKNADLLYVIKGAEAYNNGSGKAEDVGIKVIDEKTIEVTLEEPSEYFLSLLAHVTYSPISEKLYSEKKEKFGLTPDAITASGPYALKEWNHNSGIILVKNEHYWNKDAIKLDEIEIKLVVDNEAALNAFNNNEIDLIRIGSAQYEKFRNDDRIHIFQNNSVWFLLFNMENDFLKNPKIRKAIQMSINRKDLIEKFWEEWESRLQDLFPTE
jgi:oligopeptide transport system substrate-binding protein